MIFIIYSAGLNKLVLPNKMTKKKIGNDIRSINLRKKKVLMIKKNIYLKEKNKKKSNQAW